MISERFRQLVAQQLDQFCDCQELVGLGVYVAMPAADGELQLQLVQDCQLKRHQVQWSWILEEVPPKLQFLL